MENKTVKIITNENIEEFGRYLMRIGRAKGTVEQYLRHVFEFVRWFNILNENEKDSEINEEFISEWKKYLCSIGHAPATVNAKLSALNSFFRFVEWNIKISFLKIQRRMFREPQRELTRTEYERLLASAKKYGKERLALLMETICSTGIRVSEVKYITVEAVWERRAEISLKGKIRIILLPKKLCRKLIKYAKIHDIKSGEIFLTRNGTGLSRRQIWAELKGLCEAAQVKASKVFPHNLRHLFASVFYRISKDIAKLADLLGHSSIETTRIYLVTSGAEHMKQLEKMRLVL